VGGLLLGAAALALMQLLGLQGTSGALILLALGGGACIAGVVLDRAGGKTAGLAEALVAMGLVAASVAPFLDMRGDGAQSTILGTASAAIALAVLLGWREPAPATALATVAFAVASGAATQNGNLGTSQAQHLAWWLALLGWGALLLRWRGQAWASVSLGLLVAPLAVAFGLFVNAQPSPSSVGFELIMGLFLAILVGIGVATGDRGLTTGASGGLVIDAVVFAFDVGGAATAFVLLLALGGLLIWQAELLRGYFRRRDAR
jgi:hypothetical protein